MEFATGAMGTLLPKLGDLLLQECNLKKSVKKGIGDLKDELESMQGALVKVSSVPLDQLDPQIKIWANEVRELSYVIEDSLDTFVTRVEGVEPAKPKIKHLLKMVRNEHTKFKARHEIASDIKDIESQVRKIKERYDRYKIEDVVANHASTTVDPRLSALYSKASDLIGTDEQIEKLMKILSEGVGTSEKDPKIVSIVGFGGLGKTTLAKALYDKLSKSYDCQGFVPVGQNQGAKKVLRDIVSQLDIELYKAAVTMEEWQLINQLQKFLKGKNKGKRYFIVIDDLWDAPTWDTIKYAFMDSHPESTIIITTRIVDVATKAGGIYRMKPLSNDNSKLLFYTRICGGEGVIQDNQPHKVIDKILKKCAGVPLAIITIASLLVGKQSADWSKVYDAIGFGNEDSEVIQNTRKILSFSYYDLPSDLKACLLYLGMFPEDHFIDKKSLIWRWVIEGFVPDKEGMGSYEQGEICFNMLVNKSMIRRIYPAGDVNDQGGCRVHDMVLDLIRTMSRALNFITVHDMEQDGTCLRGKRTSSVRRLALHGGCMEFKSGITEEHVRSFNAVGCDNRMPLLLAFKVLRVLVIQECDFLEGHSLEHLGKLVQLRYLGLVKTHVKLPEGIGHDLKFLEVFDVRGGMINELPPSVGELNNLRCLWADKGTRMKGEIGKLTCLEELQLYSVDECPNFFTELGKLTNLRVLRITYHECEKKALAESVCNLHKIQSLDFFCTWFSKLVDLIETKLAHVRVRSLEDMAPSSRLCHFMLPGIVIPRMPSWIDSLCVPVLSELCLHVEVVEARELQALGRLPELMTLYIVSKEEKCITYTIGSAEFQKLEELATNVEISLGEGALPRLKTLVYTASAGRKDSLVPWNNRCPLLHRVICLVDCANSGRMEVKSAKAALRKAEETHPNAYLYIHKHIQNYNRKAARLIDSLEWVLLLCGLDRPDGEETIVDQRELRCMITSLETLLRDAAEPRVGRYGKQELCGFVTKFKSLLRDDDATMDKEEEPDNSYDGWYDTDSEMDRDDYLMSVLHGLDRPDGMYIRLDQPELRALITEVKDMLRDDDEPRIGRLGERDLRGMLTKFKSHLHDDHDIDKEEEDSGDDDAENTDTDDNGDHDEENGDHDGNEKEEAYNDVDSRTGGDQEGAASQL